MLRTTRRKIVSLLLSLAMILTALPLAGVTAFAAVSGDFEYTILEDGTAEITDYTGSAETLEIPSTLDGYAVTSIGEEAFYACDSLTSVTILNSVTSIGDYAFGGCNNLTSVTIPDSVTSIGDWAFAWCNSLTSVTIPESVTSIGEDAFYYCNSLTEIKVDTNNKNYSSQNGVLFDKNATELIQYTTGKSETSYDIPNSVTSIGDGAFAYCDLTSVTIPDSVTSIEYGAFHSCRKLTDIYILNKECYIDDYDNWTVPSYITIHGYSGSTAQEYANKYGNKFVALEEHPGMEKVPAKAATCTEDGNVEYYHCSDCNKNFNDKYGLEEISDVVVKATGHNMEQVPEKAATCTEDGNIKYYHCSDCNKNFKDKDGKEEVTDVVVKATGHNYENGVCTVCGEKDPNASKPSGEVSGDGKLSTVDAKWILQNIAKSREFSDEQSKAADLNGDGKLSVVDVKWVLQIVAGMRDAETLELITK